MQIHAMIPGGVTTAEGFNAAGIYGGLRGKGEKPDLALVTCDVDATSAGSFTTNVVATAPFLYCKIIKEISNTVSRICGITTTILAGQANAPTLLKLKPEEVLVESTGVIGHRTKKVIETDARVACNVWRKMVQVAVNRSFNQITVDGDTSTNDTVIALASGLCNARPCQIDTAWDGEGATCLIEVNVTGANNEAEAAKIARSVASSSLAAVYGREPNWGRIVAAAGYAGVSFHQNSLGVQLGDIVLMDDGEPQLFDRVAASNYLRKAGETHGTVEIHVSVGNGAGADRHGAAI
ncbi:hypothetical protein L6164_033555 [Bauhinia variegata]|uniref:Uncharacterized protein n=1 Tax=Bauhinia variegata TaxID=167791 RepID=A0ACB9KS18_BAUVA|nr:hypothetical protein L6164_033555 [Bauhinia variegata]